MEMKHLPQEYKELATQGREGRLHLCISNCAVPGLFSNIFSTLP